MSKDYFINVASLILAIVSMLLMFLFGILTNQEILSLAIKSILSFLIILALGWTLLKLVSSKISDEVFEPEKEEIADTENEKGANVDLTVGEENEQSKETEQVKETGERDNPDMIKEGIDKLLDLPGVGNNPLPKDLADEVDVSSFGQIDSVSK